jgi:hypothetical protein
VENKYTLKYTFAIEKQTDQLFTLVWLTSINECSCKYCSIKCSSKKIKAGVANNLKTPLAVE